MLKSFEMTFRLQNEDEKIEKLWKILRGYDFSEDKYLQKWGVCVTNIVTQKYSEELYLGLFGVLSYSFIEGEPQSWDCPGSDSYVEFLNEDDFKSHVEGIILKLMDDTIISIDESDYPSEDELWPEGGERDE